MEQIMQVLASLEYSLQHEAACLNMMSTYFYELITNNMYLGRRVHILIVTVPIWYHALESNIT